MGFLSVHGPIILQDSIQEYWLEAKNYVIKPAYKSAGFSKHAYYHTKADYIGDGKCQTTITRRYNFSL